MPKTHARPTSKGEQDEPSRTFESALDASLFLQLVSQPAQRESEDNSVPADPLRPPAPEHKVVSRLIHRIKGL